MYAHARRRFYEALRQNLPEAVWFIAQIRELYRIETQVRGLPPSERRQARLESAPQIWKGMKAKARELQPKVLPKSTLGVALNYFLSEYKAQPASRQLEAPGQPHGLKRPYPSTIRGSRS